MFPYPDILNHYHFYGYLPEENRTKDRANRIREQVRE
jgi:hypothetical protein